MKTKQLNLAGDVRLVSEGRFVASLSEAEVDVESKGLVSRSPVVVEMTDGMIWAGDMAISEDGGRVLFTGGVKASFGNDSGKADMQ